MLFSYLDILTVMITNGLVVISKLELPPIFDWVAIWQMYRDPVAGGLCRVWSREFTLQTSHNLNGTREQNAKKRVTRVHM